MAPHLFVSRWIHLKALFCSGLKCINQSFVKKYTHLCNSATFPQEKRGEHCVWRFGVVCEVRFLAQFNIPFGLLCKETFVKF